MENLEESPGDQLRSVEEKIFANSLGELEDKKFKSKWKGLKSQNIIADIFISQAVMTYLEKGKLF